MSCFKDSRYSSLGPPESQPEVSALLPVCQGGAWVTSCSHGPFSHVLSSLQSVLWWFPMERAFWGQVRVGSSVPLEGWLP